MAFFGGGVLCWFWPYSPDAAGMDCVRGIGDWPQAGGTAVWSQRDLLVGSWVIGGCGIILILQFGEPHQAILGARDSFF
ncbi:hypothetical protein CA54_57030 [Symmachiella macrocystis]|uniref:Uncharacterized protein n=1 Tax=Symmachiella macrocystis TaxID=2527985 RepID=A0A5C6B698_9PLAN|nr:hypothetical protein CA54_57030 [Symmachiella macrocystis]